MVNSKNRKRSVGAKTFESKFKCKDFIFLDFISKLITWSASSRMTPIEAIRHEFIQKKRWRNWNGGSDDLYFAALLDMKIYIELKTMFARVDSGSTFFFEKSMKLCKINFYDIDLKKLHVRESNPGLASDSRGYSPLY